MFDEEPKTPRNNKRTPEPQFNWKGLVLLGASALIIAWAFFLKQTNTGGKEKNFAEFKKIVTEGRLIVDDNSPVYLVSEPGTGVEYIEGHYKDGPDGKPTASFRTPVNIQYQK